MRGYQKLAVFIAVLLLSVSFLSAAIDILGDISEVDLDEEQRIEKTATEPAETVEAKRGKGNVVEVESAPTGAVRPLFEIDRPPATRYLRLSALEVYREGGWALSESAEAVPYDGEEIPLDIRGYEIAEDVHFIVMPLVNLSGFVPATLSVRQLLFDGTLERYPELEAFSSPTPFTSPYEVYYARHEFSEAALREADLIYPDGCLEVPVELVGRLGSMASEIVGGASTPWEKLKAVEDYLKSNYEYDEEFEPAPPGVDPVEWFLFNEPRGVCTHFNSAFVLLARSIGIPARIVNGFIVKPYAENQIVMPKQAHVYAEAPFEGLGWITLDATPERFEERPQLGYKIQTVTNITGNDGVGVKGGHFGVYGTVSTLNGSAVDGLAVEVLLKVSKNETGVRCGLGEVREGLFSITCEASPDLEVGDYMLVAHSLGDAIYEESWSDPPIKIVAETQLLLEAPGRAHTGETIAFRCRLLDSSSGEPVGNMTLLMDIDGETYLLRTDSAGTVSMEHAFETEGNKAVALRFEDSDYYLGSSKALSIAVTAPSSIQNILDLLVTYPYNLILAATSAATGAVVVLVKRRGREHMPPVAVEEEAPEEELSDDYTVFTSYKEGIVKLFNHFYAAARRRYGGIGETLTPREFQRALLREINDAGVQALEDLVSAFEIANYSEVYPTKEDYERCMAAVDKLNELMEGAEGGKEEAPA